MHATRSGPFSFPSTMQRISGPRFGERPPRRGPFLPSGSLATKRGQNRRTELTGLRAAAKSVLFSADKFLAVLATTTLLKDPRAMLGG